MVSLTSFRERRLANTLSGLLPENVREHRAGITFYACAFTVVCSLLLGGGTHGGFLSDTLLELIAIPAFLISLWSLLDLTIWPSRPRSDLYRALALCSAIALIPLLQLIPLPPWIWAGLLHREELAKVFELL